MFDLLRVVGDLFNDPALSPKAFELRPASRTTKFSASRFSVHR
jgi:hypothetical protein